MDHHSETINRLSEITDTGLFENLATSVLRAARPRMYENLTQPGVNPQGKTRKSPVDAISFVEGAFPQHMVTAHHSICARTKLKEKWLHEGIDGKSSTPDGDLIKTIAIVNEQRQSCPDMLVTLALTTNEEPPDEVTRKAQEVADGNGIKLDIWSGTRLANFLDNDPTGQWLRRRYLGIEQERLSKELLQELSHLSLEAHPTIAPDDQWVIREDAGRLLQGLGRPVAFVIGESGFGKSVSCYQYLSEHIERGGCGVVLPHDVLASALTIDDAIAATLQRLHPALVRESGASARSFCSDSSPLIVVVEDINHSGEGSRLIDKLAVWSSAVSKQEGQGRALQLVCPIWPELVAALGDETRKCVERLGARLGRFRPEDARQTLLGRAASEGVELSALEAGAVAESLGYDPLLIGLYEFESSAKPDAVIERFVGGSTERLAQGGGRYAAPEYITALGSLAARMLQERSVGPKWTEVAQWFKDAPDELGALRELGNQAAVLRIAGASADAGIVFRHDRVLNWLLVDAAIRGLSSGGLKGAIFSDPFFADIIGAAIADPSVPSSLIERAGEENPLALFHALRLLGEPSTERHKAVLAEIDKFLSDETAHTRAHQSLRYQALHTLSETQSSHVTEIIRRFRDRSWTGPLAGLRNGDLASGIDLCYSLEPGSNAVWRDDAIEHAKARFGLAFIGELDELLRRTGLAEREIVGGLRLAGHLGELSLAGAIEACWASDEARTEHLRAYLWAAAQCGGELTEHLLAPMCDAWGSLPDRGEKENSSSPRDDLGAHDIAWAFWRRLPEPALRYFIRRAAEEDLRWQITYMLRGVDHPETLAHSAHYLADRARKGISTAYLDPVLNHWQQWRNERSRSMSETSRTRLEGMWTEGQTDEHLRKASFRLWAAILDGDDLPLLKRHASDELLADEVLRARLERGDQSAIPEFIDKLQEKDTGFWWQFGKKLWSPALTDVLDGKLTERGKTVACSWEEHGDIDWITSDLVIRLERPIAEELLLKHWEHLRFSPRFLQAALYLATPDLTRRVEETIKECPDPKKMFEHIDSHFGIKQIGHPGVTRAEQVRAVIPYLDYLDPLVVHHFWDLCNERGWRDLCREHLDGALTGKWRELAGIDDATLFNELDRELEFDRVPVMDFWVQRRIEGGRTVENILGVVHEWIKTNRTPKALEVAASVLTHAGHRKDVDFLIDGSDGSELALGVIADTRFAVSRRTLA